MSEPAAAEPIGRSHREHTLRCLLVRSGSGGGGGGGGGQCSTRYCVCSIF